MRIRVLGGGWYGCHLALALSKDHEVELHEISDCLFSGASGASPARLHMGFHYPRSRLTRAACQEHAAEFMTLYGHLTRGVPVNIYAIAQHDSLVDFGTYQQVLRGEVEFVTISEPAEHGLQNVEGAVLTGERHIVIPDVADYFEAALSGRIVFGMPAGRVDDSAWDMTVDCTFCANDSENVDRYEPCVMGILDGPTDRAVTIMDGPFPSIYPWDETENLCSITSASLTPLSKTCKTWAEARALLDQTSPDELRGRVGMMLEQMAGYWPGAQRAFRVHSALTSIRAMPRSGADARLVDVVRVGDRALRVRAGKIDAILHAEKMVRDMLCLP